MRKLFFVATILFPVSAFACGWKTIASPPLDFLVFSVFFSSVGALFYNRYWREEGSRLPLAILAASIVGALGIGLITGSDNWTDLSGMFALPFLLIPYLLMRHKLKNGLVLILGITAFIAGTCSYSAAAGRTVSGFQAADPHLITEVTF